MIKNNFSRTLLLVLFYRITLDILYLTSIEPTYAYLYKFGVNFGLGKYILSIIFVFFAAHVYNSSISKKSASYKMIAILTLIYFIPGTSLYSFDNISTFYFILYSFFYFFLFFYQKLFPIYVPSPAKYFFPGKYFYILILFIFSINTILMGYFHGFNITIDFSKIYDIREEWSSHSYPVLLGYFQPYFARIIPVLIVFLFVNKKWIWVALLTVSQLLSFSFNAMKYTIFALMIGYLIALLYKPGKSNILKYFCWLNIVSLLEMLLLKKSIIVTLFQRRLSFIPNKLSYLYYDFFSNHELLYFRESFMRWFGFENPYNEKIPRVIGEYYYSRNMGANTGLVGEAFSQIGYMSVVIYPLLYVLAFRMLDYCTANVAYRKVIFTAVVLYAISFVDGAFWSILLTQGYLITCITLYFISKIKNNNTLYGKY